MNFKKLGVTAGVAIIGAALIITAQGSAQAAPAKPVSASATTGESVNSPRALGSLVNAARAVGKGVAAGAKTADNMLQHGSIFGFSSKVPEGVSVETAFDK
ncbi:hypothetical protein ACH429_03615 [Streptomyces pathocidini]|uniref:Uncharacterized protein n=1 Tax=Streptomyces pathocidini TaxID=1650571 RepID=A0ABW7UKL7_9ACTN|nr:hypothetical protein [Streptomyces pathocidini]